MLLSTALPCIKITAAEPLVKLAENQHYRIRVVQDKRSSQQLHAVAALRCGNGDEIHWLSAGFRSAAETARWMRNGFTLSQDTGDQLASDVVEELIRNGSAVGVGV